ncbi:hypothetical protein A1Q1_07366 [Trichosporon asahii var. asahii CBS 2479]|uniref:Uncharacterized protein n=1 Tax=Trichosporon asahii var. asahii (strain ATCC 90039 / CBS 2479 / JCM 2466 / KCTC 7840 / NBRC 103889/ NCYC 2677 / UAMH 7654) TaxID=1186058 RepID=J6F326_TRIAS|nr:hypothetical protein A1Q1_07366 [Trichosporon asahii var. asahii CBS 2479]EJT51394.1 hypothetical protein A1Q1_07366 [Trichosporon asahii var. asahii CBS 2479]
MRTIDHSFYPHIVDLVFHFAPFESYNVLRWVCRGWRQRVEAKFHHLRDFSVIHHSVHRLYRFRLGQQESITTTTLGACTSAKVVDLDDSPAPLGCIERYNFNTIRVPYRNRLPPGSESSFAPFECRRLVLDNHFSLKTSCFIDKLVINLRDTYDSPFILHKLSQHCWYRFFGIRHLVVIVHPINTPVKGRLHSDDRKQIVYATARALKFACECYFDLWSKPHRSRPVKPEMTLVSDGDSARLEIVIPQLRHISLEEYRTEIGEKELTIETDFNTALSP